MRIARVETTTCLLGEGPVWDVEDQALYFVDIFGRKVHRHRPDDGTTQTWDMPSKVGSVALHRDGGAVVALAEGVHMLDLTTGSSEPIALVPDLPARIALNDGKVDRRGRFVVGTTDTEIAAPIAALYSLEAGGLRILQAGLTVCNGPCWSPDDRVLYFADSFERRIHACDYDIETGDAGDRRVFAETSGLGGIPDGATVDTEGLLWVAICEGGKVAAFSPDGTVEQSIDLPVTYPSSVTFGGPGLDLLYVTSIDPRAIGRPAEPGGGDTYVLEGLGARGIEQPRYAAVSAARPAP